VTNAICALASIHHIRMLQSIGQETEDPESNTSLPRRFYSQVNEQIIASKTKNGSYTALDATAALQLVSFSLFVGGIRGWENALQIAGDWYEKTGVLQHENPLRAMWELNVTAKFASRLVVWFDIFSCKSQFIILPP
jgi:C6 transcription factor Pro1